MSDIKVIITITIPKPKMNIPSLTSAIGQESFKHIKVILKALGVDFTEMTCRYEKPKEDK